MLPPFVRWWLARPWKTFWLTVLVFLGPLLAQDVLMGSGFTDSPLFSPAPGRVPASPIAGVFVLAMPVLMLASFVWATWASWRRSKIGAITKVGVPVLAYVLLVGGSVVLMEAVRAQARLAKVNADTRAIGSALSIYAQHMGRLPATLDELTSSTTNGRGELAGPFLLRLPTAPPGWTDYGYETRADGTFSVRSEGEGRTVVSAPAPDETPAGPRALR